MFRNIKRFCIRLESSYDVACGSKQAVVVHHFHVVFLQLSTFSYCDIVRETICSSLCVHNCTKHFDMDSFV